MQFVIPISYKCYIQNSVSFRSLRPGDHLAVLGDMQGVEYYHHGIFISAEEGIVDFGGESKRDATVRCIDLLQFTDFGKRQLVRIIYPKGKCLPPEVVVENAKKLLRNPQWLRAYDMIKNNCEHFATKCKTGKAISKQVIAKFYECILNPLQIYKECALAASGTCGSSGSFGSMH